MSKVIVYHKDRLYFPFFVMQRGMILDLHSATYDTSDNILYTLYRAKVIYDDSIFETSMDRVMPYIDGINYNKIFELIDLISDYQVIIKIHRLISQTSISGFYVINDEINKMIMERACQ